MKFGELVTKCLGGSGDISFGRTAAAVIIIFCLGWDTAFVVFAMRHMDFSHMSIHDVLPSAGALLAQGGFATLFYGTNKLHSAMTDSKENK